MSKPNTFIELPPEAEPARDFIEALVARYERRIEELEKQAQILGAWNGSTWCMIIPSIEYANKIWYY